MDVSPVPVTFADLAELGYIHERHSHRAASARGDDPQALLPAVHRVASLTKRWLLGTHQGAVEDAHLASYLNEFVFRFNRRTSRSRGMVFYRVQELAVAHTPVRYNDLILSRVQIFCGNGHVHVLKAVGSAGSLVPGVVEGRKEFWPR